MSVKKQKENSGNNTKQQPQQSLFGVLSLAPAISMHGPSSFSSNSVSET